MAQTVRPRAWVERARVAALASRILEVDRAALRFGDGFLTTSEADVLRSLASRLGDVPR